MNFIHLLLLPTVQETAIVHPSIIRLSIIYPSTIHPSTYLPTYLPTYLLSTSHLLNGVRTVIGLNRCFACIHHPYVSQAQTFLARIPPSTLCVRVL